MNDTQHTPGPWIYDNSGHEGHFNIGLSHSPFLTSGVCGVRGNDYMFLGGICKEADARLMASAPDMLDALKEIACGNSAFDSVKLARAAIAKATGKDAE